MGQTLEQAKLKTLQECLDTLDYKNASGISDGSSIITAVEVDEHIRFMRNLTDRSNKSKGTNTVASVDEEKFYISGNAICNDKYASPYYRIYENKKGE